MAIKSPKKLVLAIAILFAYMGFSQEYTPFTRTYPSGDNFRYQTNIKGDLTIISNQILNRQTDTFAAEDAYNNLSTNNNNNPETGGRQNFNDFKNMQYINVDPDPSRFSSSTTALTFPQADCNQVRYAALYWSATYPSETEANGFYDGNTFTANTVPPESTRFSDWNQVKFKVPGGTYVDITADEVLFDGFNTPATQNNSPYACYADVTALVTALASPEGEYTVANIRATRGVLAGQGGSSGGWTLVVVYENPTLTGKLITTFDGFAKVADNNSVNINYNGFTTIPAGPVRADIGAAALEGDFRLTQDGMEISTPSNPTPTALSNGVNPANNFFNSNITLNGALMPGRIPSSSNTLGWDADIFALNNPANSVIANSETAATFTFETQQDSYFPYFNSFNIEIIEPDIVLEKRVEDIAGNDITGQGVNLGQILDYVLYFTNYGNDDGANYTIRDVLPINTTLDETNITMPPGTTYTYDPATRTVVFSVPDNIIEVGDPTSNIRLRVQVAENCFDFIDACTDLIQNQAFSTYQGVINDNEITDDPSVTEFNNCQPATPSATNFLLDDLSDCDFTRTVQLCGDNAILDAGDNFDSYVWVRDDNNNGEIDSTDTVQDDGDPDGDPSTLIVTQVGTYIVDKIVADPCKGFKEIINVELFGSTQSNPLVDFFNDSNNDADATNDVQGEIVQCSVDGDLLPKIFLCGSNDSQLIQINIPDAESLSWELLDETSCAPANDDCANKNLSCTYNQVGTGGDFTANAPGKYRLVINYPNGCFSRFYFDVFQNLLDIEYNKTDIYCDTDGNITITNLGANYGYQLLDVAAGTIVVPFSANNGPSFDIDTNGAYRVDVVQLDASGDPIPGACVFSTPDLGILDRDFQVNVETTPANCNAQGTVKIDILNVRGDYTYVIRLADGTLVDDETAQPDNTHTFNVNPGNYIVEASTADGCTYSENITVGDTPDPTVLAVTTRDIGCTAGMITLTGSNGFPNPDYNFAIWSHNGSMPYTDITDVPGSEYQTDPVFTFGYEDTDNDPDTPDEYIPNEDGTYVFVIVDSNNCFAFSNQVVINDNGAMTISITDDSDVSCNGSNDAGITINTVGGIGPFTYSIDAGGSTQPSPSFVNLVAGTYAIQVTDSSGCTIDQEYEIFEPDAITAEAALSQDYTCTQFGEITVGGVTPTAGGSGSYQYSIDGGSWTTPTSGGTVFTNLTDGTYTVRVRDANTISCSISLPDITIGQLPTAPTPSSTVAYNCDGTGNITVLPNDPDYIYILNGGPAQASNVFNNVAPGSHTLTIDYGLDCTVDISASVAAGQVFGANATGTTNTTCNGDTDGTITFEVENFDATTGFDYSVDGGTTYINATNSPVTTAAMYGAGTHRIELRKANETSCTTFIEQTITEPAAVIAAADITTPYTCDNAGATITARATDGIAPYQYQLEDTSGGVLRSYQTGTTFTNVTEGDYIVRARDNNGCEDEIDAPITITAPASFTYTTEPTLCYSGGNDGTVTVTVTGGNGGLLFSINGNPFVSPDPATPNSYIFENLGSGTYTVNVEDQLGCSAGTQTVRIKPAVTVSASAPEIPACGNTSTSQVRISASGGDFNFRYALVADGVTPNAGDFNTQNTRTISSGGDYDVYVRDNGGNTGYCEAQYDLEVIQDDPFTVSTSSTPILCSGSSQSTITITPNGGGAPFNYSIDDGATYQISNTFQNIPAGTYDIRVRDKNNCEATDIHVVSEPFTLSASALVAELIECNPTAGAEVRTVNARGGTPPYAYSFDGGATYQASNTSNLFPGDYTVFVRDANNCSLALDLTVLPAQTPPGVDTSLEYFCDGEATVTVNPDDPQYTYTYELDNVLNTPEDSNVFTDVPAGDHIVTVNYVLTTVVPPSTLLTEDFGFGTNTPITEIDPVYCYEPQNGTESCPAFGNDQHLQDGEYVVTNRLTNLYGTWISPNDHTGNHVDGRYLAINVGGVAGDNGVVYAKRDVEVLPNQDITISLWAFNLLRQGTNGADPSFRIELVDTSGNIIASTSTGLVPKNSGADDWRNYSVDLNPGANTTLDIVFRTNSTIEDGNDIAIDDLLATQPPAKCPAEVSVDVLVEAGRELNANIIATGNVSCNGAADGTVTFEVTNFDTVNGFEYSTDGGTTFTGPETTSPVTISGLPAGTTNIEVRDVLNNSCTVSISRAINEPDAVVTNASVTAPYTCDNPQATITATATGGTPTYQYQLEDTTGTIITPYQTGAKFTNVPVGDYIVRGRDTNGCTDPIDVPVNIVAPANPTFTAVPTNCYSGNNDATIQVDVTSGNSNYQFSLDGGPWLTPTPSNALTYTFQNLSAGTYSINVKDQLGCIGTPQNVTINPPLTANAVVDPDLTCSTPASVTINANGGSGSYSYEWSSDSGTTYATTNFTGNVFNTSNEGTYIFRVTDTSTPSVCTVITTPVTVTPADIPVITSVTPTNILCNGDATGTLNVVIDTDIGRPQFTIEVIETTTTTNYGSQVSGLPAGDYEVRITDDKGCVSLPFNVSITQPDAIDYDVNLVPITCNPSTGTDPGSITVENLTGGTAEFTYHLTGNNGYSDTYLTTAGGEDHTFAILEFGIYEVDVVDANGCSVRSTNIIASPPNDLDIDVSTTTVDCTTGGTAIVTVSSTVGSGNYEFATLETFSSPYSSSYQPADTSGGDTATFTGLIPGVTYTFVVHDLTTNCFYFETADTPINSPSNMTASLDVVANVTCKGASDGNVSFTFDNYDSGATSVNYEIFNSQSNVTTGFSGNSGVNPPIGAVSVANFATLPPGVYYILLTEVDGTYNGCSVGSPEFSITESSNLLAVTATSPKNDNCNVDAGTINAQAQFGTSPYEFQYLLDTAPAPTATSAGWTTNSFANVESGDYIVYVKDANNCIQMDAVTVGLDPTPDISLVIVDECVNEGTFEVLVTLDAAGISPYQLSVNGASFQNITFNGSNQYTITGLSSGLGQTVTVRDLNGCSDTESFDINPVLQFTVQQTALLDCEPGTDAYAEITITVTSGSGFYEYEIDGPGSVGQARTSLPSNPYAWPNASAAGPYSVSVYDIATSPPNCVKTLIIDVPDAVIPEFTETHTDVTCNGSSDGTITLQEINNGTNPLVYSINPMPSGVVLNGNTFENLPIGSYDIRGVGTNDCFNDIFSINITEPTVISVPVPTVVAFGCSVGNTSNNASISISGVSGGSGNFVRYEFINNDDPATAAVGDPIVVQNGSNTSYIETDFRGGAYTINVYDDKGCVGTQTATIEPYDELLTASAAVTKDISCNPGNDGEITVSVTSTNNDPSKFEYSIDNGTTYQTSNIFPNLGIGTHAFLIRHVDTGCIITTSQRIDDPNTFTIAIDKISDVVCFGTATGEVTFELVDATYAGGFDWEIYNTNGTPTNLTDDTSVNSGSETTNGPTTIINLPAGNYYVTVAQNNAPTCENMKGFSISGPVEAIAGDTEITEVTCALNDGSIEIIDAIGGWGGYSYFVDVATNPAPTDATGFQTNPLFENLSGGPSGTDYQVWIADSEGCLQQLPNVNLIDPTPITADLQLNEPNCIDLSAEIEVINEAGGQGSNYSYQLQVFNTTTSNYENLRPIQTSDVFSGLGEGRYQVIISDQWSCSAVTATPIEIYAPIVPLATVIKTIDCSVGNEGGAITITQTGGSGSFDYEVRYPGTLPADSADDTNTTGVFTGLTLVGDYTFTLTDQDAAQACPTNIVQSLQAAIYPILTIDSADNVTCNGADNGIINVSATNNGVGPYTFEIVSGDGSSVGSPIVPTSSTATTATFSGLAGTVAPGITYTIRATGTNSCFVEETQTIVEPELIANINATVVAFGCAAGNNLDNATITIDTGITGGSGTYVRYEFINTDTSTTVQNGANNSYTETNFDGGNYTINVYDENGCTGSTTASITPFDTLQSATVVIIDPISCVNGGEDIRIDALGSLSDSNTAPANYEYRLLPSGIFQASNLFNDLAAGSYAFEIRNVNTGCVISTTHEVKDPNTFDIVIDKISDVQCFGDDGRIRLSITDPTYTGGFVWMIFDTNGTPSDRTDDGAFILDGTWPDPGPTGNIDVPAGTYLIEVMQNGFPQCTQTEIFTITTPSSALTVAVSEESSPSCTDDQGRILVNPSGGQGPYTILLENTATAFSETQTGVSAYIFSGLAGGDYGITVTDTLGCLITDTITLITPDAFTATISNTDLTCFNGNSASVTATIGGTRNVTPVYLYQLLTYNETGATLVTTSATQSTGNFQNLPAGFYQIRVSDDLGCEAFTNIIEIENPQEVTALLTRTSPLTCDSGIEFQLTAGGGSGTYEYSVDNINFTPMVGNTVNLAEPVAGTYSYYVRDAIGCPSVQSNEITEDVVEDPTLSTPVVVNVACNGELTGSISTQATGGLGNYQYSLYTDAALTNNYYNAGDFQATGQFTNLPAGIYYIEVVSGDCEATTQAEITELPSVEFLQTQTDVSCAEEDDGTITISNNGGGTGLYQYAITDPNGTDLKQFTEPLADATYVFTDLEGSVVGTVYRVIAQDSNGCFMDFTVSIFEPEQLGLTTTTTPVACNGDSNGTITLNITGGTPPFMAALNSTDDADYIPVTDGYVFTDLASGFYEVRVRDAGCSPVAAVPEVGIGVNLNAEIEPVYECDGNTLGNYINVNLEDPSVMEDILYALDSSDPADTSDLQLNPDFRDLAPGPHTLTILHSNSCEKRIDFTIEDFEQLGLVLQNNTINVITAEATGGKEEYTYFFNDDDNGTDNTYNINQSGTYTVRVVDSNGCEVVQTIEMEFIDIEIPNFFSPDGDGLNDTFIPRNQEGFPEILTIIFDRYGREVYRMGLNDKGWSGLYHGKELPTGDYWYVIKLRGENDPREFVGHFTLYR